MVTFSRWDDWLVAEHEMIERAMEVLKTNLGKVSSGTFDVIQTARAIDFFWNLVTRFTIVKKKNSFSPAWVNGELPSKADLSG